MDDIENLNEEELTKDFQFNQHNPFSVHNNQDQHIIQTEEDYIEQYGEDYLADQFHEILGEELSLLETEFLDSKGI